MNDRSAEFDAFMSAAWAQHAEQPAAVAQRLASEAPSRVVDGPQFSRLVHLLHHVHGAHLGGLDEGRAALEALAAHPVCGGTARADLQRALSSLALSAGSDAALAAADASDRIRIQAMAAANLVERDTPRAMQLFGQAVQEARAADLPASDPIHRALAVAANNLACTLEDKPQRSDDERALMIEAAEAARHHWALAGTWLETERAEYRLAMTWLQAGDPARALGHARRCLEIVVGHDGPALERFFAWEALGQAWRAADAAAELAQAVAEAEKAFATLPESDRSGCGPSLDRLRA